MTVMKGLIFDMDGLMIDSEGLYFEAERKIASFFGKRVEEETLWKMMGRNPIESMKIFVEDLEIARDAEEMVEWRNRIMRDKLNNDLVPMPGLVEMIDEFYHRLKLAICTGAQKEFLDIVVDKLGIREKFAVLQASDEIRKGKPNPEIYLKTCERLHLRPEESFVLEDSSNGALAAKKAGCYVVAVPTEYTKAQEFGFVDFVARDLFEAKKHLGDRLF